MTIQEQGRYTHMYVAPENVQKLSKRGVVFYNYICNMKI